MREWIGRLAPAARPSRRPEIRVSERVVAHRADARHGPANAAAVGGMEGVAAGERRQFDFPLMGAVLGRVRGYRYCAAGHAEAALAAGVGRAALARFGFPVVVAAHRGSMGKTSRPVKPPPPVPAVVWWPCGGAARRRLLKGRPTPPQGAAP